MERIFSWHANLITLKRKCYCKKAFVLKKNSFFYLEKWEFKLKVKLKIDIYWIFSIPIIQSFLTKSSLFFMILTFSVCVAIWGDLIANRCFIYLIVERLPCKRNEMSEAQFLTWSFFIYLVIINLAFYFKLSRINGFERKENFKMLYYILWSNNVFISFYFNCNAYLSHSKKYTMTIIA